MSSEDVLSVLLNNPPTSVESLLNAVNTEIYTSLKDSVQLRRWPNGDRLSDAQLENAMQLIILYEHQHLPAEKRTGQPLNDSCGSGGEEVRALEIRSNAGSEKQ